MLDVWGRSGLAGSDFAPLLDTLETWFERQFKRIPEIV
jgi:hypothetical protein